MEGLFLKNLYLSNQIKIKDWNISEKYWEEVKRIDILIIYFKNCFTYLKSRQRQRAIKTALIHWITPQMHTWLGYPSWSLELRMQLGLPTDGRTPNIWVSTCCLLGCMLTGGWNWRKSWNRNPCTSTWDIGIPCGSLKARSKLVPWSLTLQGTHSIYPHLGFLVFYCFVF